jgi:hypothetical protein
MPGRDGNGPEGKGPMTGRKLGPCNKDAITQPLQYGRGMGCGRGCGRGFGRGFGRKIADEKVQNEEKQ